MFSIMPEQSGLPCLKCQVWQEDGDKISNPTSDPDEPFYCERCYLDGPMFSACSDAGAAALAPLGFTVGYDGNAHSIYFEKINGDPSTPWVFFTPCFDDATEGADGHSSDHDTGENLELTDSNNGKTVKAAAAWKPTGNAKTDAASFAAFAVDIVPATYAAAVAAKV